MKDSTNKPPLAQNVLAQRSAHEPSGEMLGSQDRLASANPRTSDLAALQFAMNGSPSVKRLAHLQQRASSHQSHPPSALPKDQS